jgi:hypothetical protein
VAKGANIVLVVSGQRSTLTDTVYSSANYVVQNNTAKILNVSYGLCELFEGTSGNAAYNNLWESAAAEGIAVFVASGDSGSPACDQGLTSSVPYGAKYGLSVSGLASTPYNTAVGGTDFNWCKPTVTSSGQAVGCSTAAPYWNTTNSSTGASANGYVPEVPWNNSCSSATVTAYLESLANFLHVTGVVDSETACNFVINNYQWIYQQYGVNLAGFVYPKGGGGGASNCTSGDGSTAASCTGGYTKPNWQTGVTGIPSDGKRDIPDVSFFASNGFFDSAYLICVSATGACINSTSLTTEPVAQEVGGTSVSSPAMAGVMALINQKTGTPQGSPNAELYQLGTRQTYANCTAETAQVNNGCYFNDVDASTIAMPCKSGALDCTVNHSGDSYGILSGYTATSGFDPATGLGSLNVANVVNGWTSIFGTASVTVTVTPSQSSVLVNQSLTVTVNLTGDGTHGIPTGNVALVGGGYIAVAGTLSNGTFTFNIPAYSLAAGNDTLTVSYSGDGTYAGATGTASITVSKLSSSVTAQPSTQTANANTAVVVVAYVAGSSGGPVPTGTMQMTGGGASPTTCTLNYGSCGLSVNANSLSNGTDTLTITYSGDKNYSQSSTTATVTVNILTPTVTVLPLSGSPSAGSSFQITVSVAGSGPTPAGYVQLLGGGYGSGMLYLNAGSYTFSIPAKTMYAGSNTVEIFYFGDSIYAARTISTTVNVVAIPTRVTLVPASNAIASGQGLSVTAMVTSDIGMPTGSVKFTYGSVVLWTTPLSPVTGATYPWTIPPNTLAAGTDTINATYTGDSYYGVSSGAATVDVTQSTFSISASSPTPTSVSRGSSAASTVTIASASNYSGLVTFTCALNSGGPANQVGNSPTCAIPTKTFAVSQTATATVTTVAATSGAFVRPESLGRGRGLAAGATALALVFWFGLPAWRRRWRGLLGALTLLFALGGFAACGGGGSSSTGGGSGGSGNPGTASGTYTFTVTAAGNPAVTPAPTASFAVTVN